VLTARLASKQQVSKIYITVNYGHRLLGGSGGAMRDRTADLLRARQALSQLSYSPKGFFGQKLVGLGRLELPTSPLSGVRSNQLSYRPINQTGR
jgi:hypothetical protein